MERYLMKLLRVCASNFKNCIDDFTIDLVPKSRKYSEDKEYELLEIAEDLYVYTTAAFVGKNAFLSTSPNFTLPISSVTIYPHRVFVKREFSEVLLPVGSSAFRSGYG